jgi:NAD+ synthase (glutamine-hydrolysing)
MRYALAQINTRVGDVERNVRRSLAAIERAVERGADVVLFPELTIPGYPPHDGLFHRSLVSENLDGVKTLAAATAGSEVQVLVGFVDVNRELFGHPLYNGLAQLSHGEVVDIFYKTLLPSYDVFDETRYFKPNDLARVGRLADGSSFAPLVCEDLWHEVRLGDCFLYDRNPVDAAMLWNPGVLLSASCSPWSEGKDTLRLATARGIVKRHEKPFLYVNLVGMNEGLLFDGGSFVLGADGQVEAAARRFEEALLLWDYDPEARPAQPVVMPEVERPAQWFDGLVMGLRDFFDKTGQPPRAVIGLSGGIDSALVACLAVEALGPQAVVAATLPSAISSPGSVEDSRALAANLGIPLHEIPIRELVTAANDALAPAFQGLAPGLAEENIQARARGLLLMALANKLGGTVLNTGNKSELAVGYCTLYGDLIGGLAPLADLYKTEVYELSHWYNRARGRSVIPEIVLCKPPSAELRPGQTDQDDLPPYEVLDSILRAYLEEQRDAGQIVAATGQPAAVVQRVLGLVGRSEYKRRQAPPPLRLHGRAFGLGWRYPFMGRFPR